MGRMRHLVQHAHELTNERRIVTAVDASAMQFAPEHMYNHRSTQVNKRESARAIHDATARKAYV